MQNSEQALHHKQQAEEQKKNQKKKESYQQFQLRRKKQMKQRRRFDSDQEGDIVCPKCEKPFPHQKYNLHLRYCTPQMRECKHCHQQFPQYHIYDHQGLCRKNPVAKAMRKLYPSSSDPSDSSDQQNNQVQRRQFYRGSDSDGEQQTEFRIPVQQRGKQSFFQHKPRRQYRLSQSSSEEDQRQKYWRNFHEEFHEVPKEFYVRMLNTDLEGITISVSTEGPNGRIIRRTVHNQLTGKFETISNHRYQRHYRSHVIDEQSNYVNNGPNQRNGESRNGAVMIRISNRANLSDYMGNLIANESGLSKNQILSLDRQKHVKKEKDEEQTCAICCHDLNQGDYYLKIKCGHKFHQVCLAQWLLQKSTCPLCKSNQR